MLNVKFDWYETVKVIFVNGHELVLEDVVKVEEDESGYVHFTNYYGEELLTANGKNMIGFQKQ